MKFCTQVEKIILKNISYGGNRNFSKWPLFPRWRPHLKISQRCVSVGFILALKSMKFCKQVKIRLVNMQTKAIFKMAATIHDFSHVGEDTCLLALFLL